MRQLLTDSPEYKVIKEGEADILVLVHNNDVYYNSSQVVNRDLSIAVLRNFVGKITSNDMFSAFSYLPHQRF